VAIKDLALITGAGIGGLATGALLCKRGFRVLILERSSRIGGCCGTFRRAGYNFDFGPTLIPDFLWSGLDLILRELELKLDRVYHDPFFQICLPGHRVAICRDPKATQEEWAREFPELLDDLKAFHKHLTRIDNFLWQSEKKKGIKTHTPFQGNDINYSSLRLSLLLASPLLKRLSAKIILSDNLKRSPYLNSLDLQTLYWGQIPFSRTSLAYSAILLNLPLRGGFQIKGGSGTICEIFSRYIKDRGGERRLNCNVSKIKIGNNEVVGLKLDDGAVFEGRCYIANTTPWTLYENLLPATPETKDMVLRLKRAPYPSGVFTLFLGLKDSCLPPQIGVETLFSPGENNAPPLFISVNSVKRQEPAPEGFKAMRVYRYTPTKTWSGNKEEYILQKRRMEEETIQSLKSLIPFIDEGISFRESATPLTYERYTARPNGMVKGIPQTSSIFKNKALSEFTCYNNLFMINDCIAPSIGVEGICRVALRITDFICKKYS